MSNLLEGVNLEHIWNWYDGPLEGTAIYQEKTYYFMAEEDRVEMGHEAQPLGHYIPVWGLYNVPENELEKLRQDMILPDPMPWEYIGSFTTSNIGHVCGWQGSQCD